MVFLWMWVFAKDNTTTITQPYVKAWKKCGTGIWWLFTPFFEPKK